MADAPAPEEPAAPQEPAATGETATRRSPLKCWLYGTLATLAAGGIGYGVAYGQGQGAINAVQAELDSRVKAHADEKRAWDEQMAKLRRENALLDARRTLDSALLALESNNFGIAQQRLEQAGLAIAKNAGDDSKLKAVAAKIGDYHINVTGDIREQRAGLNTLLASVDQAIGE
jgi:hypothetical protein